MRRFARLPFLQDLLRNSAVSLTIAALLAGTAHPREPRLKSKTEAPKQEEQPRLQNAAAAQRAFPRVQGALTLQRAIEIAVRWNADVTQALAEIKRTAGQVVEVRAQALPTVKATGTYSQTSKELIERRNRSGGTSAASNALGLSQDDFESVDGDKSWRTTLELRQLVYSGGKVQAALKIAGYRKNASQLRLKETVARVVAQVRQQFNQVLLDRALITVAEESIRLLEDELKDQKNRFAAGTVPKFNVLRAEVELANAKPDLIRARNNLRISELNLAKLIGAGSGTSSVGNSEFTVTGVLGKPRGGWNLRDSLEHARKHRPILQERSEMVLSETQNVTVARAGYQPELSVNTGWEMRSSALTDDLSQEINGWFIGVTGSWNLFDGFETFGKIKQAESQLESARIQELDAREQVNLEVQRAIARLEEAEQLLASLAKVVEQAEEALRLARERLAAGTGTQLDVLDARVALTRARTTELQGRYDLNAAHAEHDRAIGRTFAE
jgi:outer membrane protein TolC